MNPDPSSPNPSHNWERLKNWAPVSIEFGTSMPVVSWRDLRSLDFREPFFFQTLNRVREENKDGEVTTGIGDLLRLENLVDSVPPKGFIFHVSRCGSTLVSNALRTLDRTIVMSEAQPISAAVWLHFDTKNPAQSHELFRGLLLKAILRSLGQKVTGAEDKYFIKFANVDILQIKQIRRIWPSVPWVFMIRNPEEVIVSNMRKDSTWIRIESHLEQSAMMLGCDTEEVRNMSREEYGARMIGQTCSVAAENVNNNSMFIDYGELTSETLVKIARFFGVDPSPLELSQIYETGAMYSKDPTKVFQSDSEGKRQEASALIRAQSEKWALEGYLKALAVANRHLDNTTRP